MLKLARRSKHALALPPGPAAVLGRWRLEHRDVTVRLCGVLKLAFGAEHALALVRPGPARKVVLGSRRLSCVVAAQPLCGFATVQVLAAASVPPGAPSCQVPGADLRCQLGELLVCDGSPFRLWPLCGTSRPAGRGRAGGRCGMRQLNCVHAPLSRAECPGGRFHFGRPPARLVEGGPLVGLGGVGPPHARDGRCGRWRRTFVLDGRAAQVVELGGISFQRDPPHVHAPPGVAVELFERGLVAHVGLEARADDLHHLRLRSGLIQDLKLLGQRVQLLEVLGHRGGPLQHGTQPGVEAADLLYGGLLVVHDQSHVHCSHVVLLHLGEDGVRQLSDECLPESHPPRELSRRLIAVLTGIEPRDVHAQVLYDLVLGHPRLAAGLVPVAEPVVDARIELRVVGLHCLLLAGYGDQRFPELILRVEQGLLQSLDPSGGARWHIGLVSFDVHERLPSWFFDVAREVLERLPMLPKLLFFQMEVPGRLLDALSWPTRWSTH